MHKIIIFAFLAMTSMSGCSAITGGGDNSNDSRWIAASKIADAKYAALQARYEAQNERYQVMYDQPTATVTTIDSGGEPVTVKINIAPLVLAIKDDHGNYQIEPDVMPKGAFAESVDSVGGLIGKVWNSPVTAIFAAGYLAGEIGDSAGDRNYVQEGDIIGSNNNTKTIGSGTATGPVITPETVFEPYPVAE